MAGDGVSVWIACLKDLRTLLSSSSSTSTSISSSSGEDGESKKRVFARIAQNTQLVGPEVLPVSVAGHTRLVNDLKVGTAVQSWHTVTLLCK